MRFRRPEASGRFGGMRYDRGGRGESGEIIQSI